MHAQRGILTGASEDSEASAISQYCKICKKMEFKKFYTRSVVLPVVVLENHLNTKCKFHLLRQFPKFHFFSFRYFRALYVCRYTLKGHFSCLTTYSIVHNFDRTFKVNDAFLLFTFRPLQPSLTNQTLKLRTLPKKKLRESLAGKTITLLTICHCGSVSSRKFSHYLMNHIRQLVLG